MSSLSMLKINDELYIDDLVLLIKSKNKKIGVISDTHVGFIRFLNKKGIFLVDKQVDEIINHLKHVKKLDYFIINGDFFHEFAKVDNFVLESAHKLIDFIKKNVSENLIIVKGNHDKIIDKVLNEKIVDYFEFENYIFTHGDRILDLKLKNKILVIGHEHPAVCLNMGARNEEYKCFLVSKKIVVLPSFNLLSIGHNIIEDRLMSPYLIRKEVDDMDVFVVYDKKEIYFHKVKDLVADADIKINKKIKN